ncbi:SDR family oxidoreductase [Desertifilum sp. FACHB-1129]|uniref:Oxidoreductase n=2 Tax=Desertifilum tharense IPPAS B-1220 TaxID=1781255 RepID=A0A1E5QKT9_9CYAN|nr:MULTISPECIES: SDR family oxidoreductase [Desertifilum]MDA0210248.1 SDR family oxidoreductase [Cyanobacteria bacterium FC1]MBD2310194.1 SDR family oxidoreductase [Desertifilum sp. FACHB-1129]MBD2322570.1 SDR family oxidoreductase [Desertifilum sp. FACHB-866]MBD2334623.1 SDR family oxidoreductase [Desertifilum sp. FACHB-868]OEJ75238.1 oxidoreductase [Desertifilum tharense IPPAS B-1220]
MLNVENKVIAITGASSGIGEATAKLLAENGAKVVLGARRTDRLEKLVEEIRHQGGSAEFKTVNVTDREDMKAFIHFAKDTFGRIDVIFNNAGVMPLSPMSALKVEEWDAMINVNINGVLNGIAAGLPIMEAQGGGQFINTASIAAHMVVPTSAVYCATKYAVWAISEGLRQESENIRVTIISPGVVETELGSDITDDSAQEALKEFRKSALTPDAIARAVLYAVSQPDDVDVNEIIVRPTTSAF